MYICVCVCVFYFPLLLSDAILRRGSLDPLLFLHWTVLQLHCTNLMKGVEYCLYTFQKGGRGFLLQARGSRRHGRRESADRNIK